MKRVLNANSIYSIFILIFTLSLGVEKLIDTSILGVRILLPEIIVLLFSIPLIAYSILKRRGLVKLKNPVFYLVLIYSSFVFISWIISGQNRALVEWYGTLYFLFILSLILFNGLKHDLIYIGLIGSGLLVSIFGIVGYGLLAIGIESNLLTYYPDYPIVGTVYRLTGLVRNPMLSADLIVFGIVSYFIFSCNNTLLKKYELCILGILSIGLVFTFTKSMLILIGLLLIFKIPKSVIHIPVMSKFIGGIMILLYLFNSHFIVSSLDNQHLLKQDYTSGEMYQIGNTDLALYPTAYTAIKVASIEGLKRNFPLGVGGNCQQAFHFDLFKEGFMKKSFHLAPHSTYFGALGELGILGLGIIIFLYISLYILIVKTSQKENNWMMILFWFIILSGLTMDNMNLRHHWIFVGLLATLYLVKINSAYRSKLN